MKKIGRNDPCSCGSGKKYKKCCEAKESAAKKLTAHKIESEDLSRKATDVSGLFQKFSFFPPAKVEEVSSQHPEEAPRENSEPPEKS